MDWSRDLPTWPLNHLSRRVTSAQCRWHVQEAGTGPTVLLLHGAGSSTHTWRDLLPRFAESHHTVALDLPGQGFSRARSSHRMGLAEMTEDIAALCDAEGWHPDIIIGHSAGAALALSLADRSAASGQAGPKIIGINAALGHFEGMASWLFPLLARALALNPLTAVAFTLGGRHHARARRLIEGTGSTLPDSAIALYARLLADRHHVDATLQMMARWDIDPLLARLNRIPSPCLLIAADRDLAVPARVSLTASASLPAAEYRALPDLGHLAHEEAPAAVADLIEGWLNGLDARQHS